ncbi:hypothetical protein PR202_ga15469 [Eleusine coracana subsp. coracana]|uniref:Uncharacterized protein n=1 Tax=Eleusine coracana subsp. coracana TaxID=191504 RepID=A0AAV5CK69_ELECO|nr:hypothetical protein PR202_ga15469 [Eleusine coracana subsp. coracana]
MAATSLFSLPSLRLLSRASGPSASRFQTLAARKQAASTVVSGGGGGGGGLLSVLDRALAGGGRGGVPACACPGWPPMYIATRGLYNLKPPTVFVPPCIKDDVEELLQVHRRMSQVELNVELVALDLGETYEIRNDLVARPFQTYHVIPSQGYIIYSIRKKLKKQYAHLKGSQIAKLKQSGAEITDTILYPEVAFTGDTKSDFIIDPRNADALRAKVLITEATFLDDHIDVEHAREHGHMHLSESKVKIVCYNTMKNWKFAFLDLAQQANLLVSGYNIMRFFGINAFFTCILF